MKRNIATTLLVLLSVGALRAQQVAPTETSKLAIPYDDRNAPDARDIIFSNLEPLNGELYYSDPYYSFAVAGKSASGTTETWAAIAFTPRVDVQAKVLLAAITYISGTKRVNLGIYSNNDNTGSVGTLLPGGQGIATQIPDSGNCCQLVKVTLPGSGVTLTAGTTYWLVAGPDNVNAPTFSGTWQISYLGKSAYLTPPGSWSYPPGAWPAAEIRGTSLQDLAPSNATDAISDNDELRSSPAKSVIFTNLGPTSTDLYNPNNGLPIQGDSNGTGPELWEALPFTVKANVHAKLLAAPIAYVSGLNRKVNLALYSDNQGAVGSLLPGGQGSTTQIPDSGSCCELTTVRLPGAGVALSAGHYWLVASPDNVEAPTFKGLWRVSNVALSAYQEPENFTNWTDISGDWLAAEIRGTNP